MPPSYKRVLLKISGEILAGKNSEMFDHTLMERLAKDVQQLIDQQIEVTIVVGAGNLVRGIELEKEHFDRVTADYMGMTATIINGLALQDVFERCGLKTRVMSAIESKEVVEPFIRRRATRHAEKGRVVILVGGTGNPYFTTDSAAVLRASELGCDILLKGTKVDGVYSADPAKDSSATRYDRVSYDEILQKKLRVMDMTAFALARDNELPILIFNILEEGTMLKAAKGDMSVGTLVLA